MQSRLSDAFWSLLEDHDLHDITVGDIVQVAGCNRGSFYYYYDSRDDFIKAIVRDGFINKCGLFRCIFDLIAGDDPSPLLELDREGFERLALLMQHGGSSIVESQLESYSMDLWSTVLCVNGETLQPETLEIIQFLVNGILGVIVNLDCSMVRKSESASQAFLEVVIKQAIKSIASIQGMEEDEIVMRIRLLGQYRKINSNRKQAKAVA